jgi:hypothetical protein
MPRVTEYMLKRILDVQARLEHLNVEIDDILACKSAHDEIHAKYVAHKKALSDAKSQIDQYVRALRAEPCMATLLDLVASTKKKSAKIKDDDIANVMFMSMIEDIDSIFKHGRKPHKAKVTKAEKACDAFEQYMLSDDVQYIILQANRAKPVDDNNKPKKHMLSEQEQEWAAYMSLKD